MIGVNLSQYKIYKFFLDLPIFICLLSKALVE